MSTPDNKTSQNEPFNYTGNEELFVMEVCKQYNGHIVDLILKHMPLDCTKILDFGGGIGTLAKQVTKRATRPTVVELDEDQQAYLRSNGFEVHASIDSQKDGSLDYIYSSNVLEHIENDQEMLNIFNTKLRSGGNLFLYVPAFMSLFSHMDEKVGHFRRYTHKDLIPKLENAGFKVNKWSYADSVGYFATLAFKLIDKGDGQVSKGILTFYDSIIFPISKVLDIFVGKFFGKNIWISVTKK